jgi:hypothetical protein
MDNNNTFISIKVYPVIHCINHCTMLYNCNFYHLQIRACNSLYSSSISNAIKSLQLFFCSNNNSGAFLGLQSVLLYRGTTVLLYMLFGSS